MIKPSLLKLWAAFPDHSSYPTLKDLYTNVGGGAEKNIDKSGFCAKGNTCASRMSVAFNRAGAPINMSIANVVNTRTLGAADGSRIIYGVEDLRKYLVKLIGKPLTDIRSPYDDAFLGRRGIIAFSVNWSGASGHIALWNGTTYREPAHDNYSTYINPVLPDIRTSRGEFWELAP